MEGVQHGDEVGLVGHDLVDVLWPSTMGSRAVFSARRMLSGSMSLTHETSLGLMVVGMGGTSLRCRTECSPVWSGRDRRDTDLRSSAASAV